MFLSSLGNKLWTTIFLVHSIARIEKILKKLFFFFYVLHKCFFFNEEIHLKTLKNNHYAKLCMEQQNYYLNWMTLWTLLNNELCQTVSKNFEKLHWLSYQDLIKVCYTTRGQICDFIFKSTGKSSSVDWIQQWIGIILFSGSNWIRFTSGLESFLCRNPGGEDLVEGEVLEPLPSSCEKWFWLDHFCLGTQVVKTWFEVKFWNLSLIVTKIYEYVWL